MCISAQLSHARLGLKEEGCTYMCCSVLQRAAGCCSVFRLNVYKRVALERTVSPQKSRLNMYVLQCVVTVCCCSVLQCVAACCMCVACLLHVRCTVYKIVYVLQCVVTVCCCSVLQCVAMCCMCVACVLQCVAVYIKWLSSGTWLSSRTLRRFNTLQHTATHCNTLQHTPTHCNTLQHTWLSNACI